MSIESSETAPRGTRISHFADKPSAGESEPVKEKTEEVAEAALTQGEEISPRPLKRKQARELAEGDSRVSSQFSEKIAKRSPADEKTLTEEQSLFVQRQLKKNLAGRNLETIRAFREDLVGDAKRLEPDSLDFKISQIQMKVIDSVIAEKEKGIPAGWQNPSVRQFFEENCLGAFDREAADQIIAGRETGSWLLRKESTGDYCFTMINASGNTKHLRVDHRAIAHVRDFIALFPYSKQVTGLVHDLRNQGRLSLQDAEALLEGKGPGTWLLYQALEQRYHPTVARMGDDGIVRHRAIEPRLAASGSRGRPFELLKKTYGYEAGKFLAPAKMKQRQKQKILRAAHREKDIYLDDDRRAKALGLGYRSEYLDQKHGYSLDLEPWWEHWVGNDRIQESFNEWLDKVRKGERPLGSEPLSDLQIEKVRQVKYFNEVEREAYEVVVRDGQVFIRGEEEPLHCNGEETYVFVQSPSGTLYAGLYERGILNHSSFLSGRPVIACGEMILKHGRVTKITDKSGHYLTTPSMFCQGMIALSEQGVNFSDVEIYRMAEDGNYIRDYRSADEVVNENAEIQNFAENHFISNIGYQEARKLISGEAPGVWNMTYSSEDRDFVVNVVDDKGAIQSLLLGEIYQSSDTLITFFCHARVDELLKLEPFLGMDDVLYEKLQSLGVKPFPLSVDEEFIAALLTKKPTGTWLVRESPDSGHDVMFRHEGNIYRFKLAERSTEELSNLSGDHSVSYGEVAAGELGQLSDLLKLESLEVEPFPKTYSSAEVSRLLEGEPDGAWLIHESEDRIYDLFVVIRGKVMSYSLENQVARDLDKLSPEGKISFAENVVDRTSSDGPVILNESLPKATPQRIQDGAEKMMAFLLDKNLYYGERVAVKKQIALSLSYLAKQGKEKISEAAKRDKPLYILPKEILSELEEGLENRKIGQGQEAYYKAAHIQINPDGIVNLIPKHPKLALGAGSFKNFRLAIELAENFEPQNLNAFGSMIVADRDDLSQAVKEKEFIDQFLQEEARESGLDETLPVRIAVYDSTELYDSLSVKEGEVSKLKMVLPYANLGDCARENYSREEIPYILLGMTKCVRVMHQLGVAIQDVKNENFLADRDSSGKVNVVAFDFGGAEHVEGLTAQVAGSQGWFSPEKWRCYFNRLKPYDPMKADIFALGLSLHSAVDPAKEDVETYYRKAPEYLRQFVVKIEQAVDAPTIEFLLRDYQRDWGEYSPVSDFEKLIKSMLNPDPLFRPDIETVSKLLPKVLVNDPEAKEELDKMIRPPTLEDYLEKISIGACDSEEAKDILAAAPSGSWFIRHSVSEGAFVVVRKNGPGRDHVSQLILNRDGSLDKFKENYPENMRL